MSNTMIQLAIFTSIGIAWRYFKPGHMSADALQRSIMTLVHWVFMPIFIFFAISALKFNASLLKYSMYILVSTGVAMTAAWFWLKNSAHQNNTKGALLIASSFGSVFFIGLPLTKAMIGGWTGKIAVVYLVVANVLILYTVGLFLIKAMATPSKLKKPLTAFTDAGMRIIKEPIIIAVLLGLLVNIAELKLPGWIRGLNGLAAGGLVPLLLLAVGLTLNWDKSWTAQIQSLIPVAAIKLILVPLTILIMIKVFGSPGAKTAKALIIDGIMPASLLGFVICDRFKLDTRTYAVAFSLTAILAIIAVPVWMKLI